VCITRVAVLGYHKIGPPPDDWWSWQYVPGDVFAAQIRALRDDGWEAIAVDDLLRGLEAPAALTEKAFLVTFDDAYLSLRQEALRQLELLDLPAAVFTPTSFVGGWNSFDQDTEPREAICNWDTLRALGEHGVSIQSHGVSHRAFSTLALAEQEQEVEESRRLLEERLGSPVKLFAYPYGDAGRERGLAEVLRRAGYTAAFGYGGGPFTLPAEEPYLLPRIAIGPDTDLNAEIGSG